MRIRVVLALCLVLIVLISSSCAVFSGSSSTFDSRLSSIVHPYTFNLADWELKTLFNELKQRTLDPPPASALNSQSAVNYFSYMAMVQTLQSDMASVQSGKLQGNLYQYEDKLKEVEAKKNALKDAAEQTIARQISETLASQGIYNPINNMQFMFPPVNFTLEDPLYILIISPRDKIEHLKDVTISQAISPEQMQNLEAAVDKLNVSSLVVEIGGLGATYPSFVLNNSDLRWTIDTAIHEWLHQYLTFKPLGFRYVLDLLGLANNSAITTINETAVSMAARELGTLVYNKYYSQYQAPQTNAETNPVESGFDFNVAMRDIRQHVDAYLAQGQVAQAEQYMETQRQYLITKGFYIRKLNQAYFAFYGSYADSPTSVDPIGNELRQLRQHNASIKVFLDTVSGFTSVQDLQKALNQFN